MTSNGPATIHKVGTDNNPADLLTKYLDSTTIDRHIIEINLHPSHHRPSHAPMLTRLNLIVRANMPSAHPGAGGLRSQPSSNNINKWPVGSRWRTPLFPGCDRRRVAAVPPRANCFF